MAGRFRAPQGSVLRTYARLRPLRRVESQKWLSPADHRHLFSSSSSHLDSSCEESSLEDFTPSARKSAPSRRRVNLKPVNRSRHRKKNFPRRKRRKKEASSGRSDSDEKENDGFQTTSPSRRFVTLRRKAPADNMKPPSSRPRRVAHPILSPETLCDFEADNLTVRKRRRMRRMCSDVTNLRSPSAEPLHSPLQNLPLLSSTPSMTLTAVPRTGKSFVRQLALCEPLEDSVVICGVHSAPGSNMCEEGGISDRVTGSEIIISDDSTYNEQMEPRNPGAKTEAEKRCADKPGSGVQRLVVTTRNISSVCLLSPVMVSSPAPPSVFGASAELFSGDFTLDQVEMSTRQPGNQVVGAVLGSRHSPWNIHKASPDKEKYFSRRRFQPFVKLDSRMVTEYLQRYGREAEGSNVSAITTPAMQRSPDAVPRSPDAVPRSPDAVPRSPDAVPRSPAAVQRSPAAVPRSPGAVPRSPGAVQPVVTLDPAAVSRYLQHKEKTSEQHLRRDESAALDKPGANPRNADSSVLPLGCFSPIFQTKTPLVMTSVLKNKETTSVPPQTVGTGRKVCISGFSAKRWGTLKKNPSTKTQQKLCFQDQSREDLGAGDLALASSSFLFSTSLLTSSFLNSTAAMNLNLSTESMTEQDPQKEQQRWARLRAALSLHRRKKVEAGSPLGFPVKRFPGGKVSLSSHNSSLLLLSPFQSQLYAQELTDADKVFAECRQDQPIPFHHCITPDQLRSCQKVGEGVYGEVFRTLRGGRHVALKVIPIEGTQKVNGEHQKSFAEILPEIIISKELSLLNEGEENRSSGFIQLHSAHCVRGSYPPELLSSWDKFADEKGTENERPDSFCPEQLFMILEFEFGGEDLERMCCKLPSVAAARSILHQVTAALAVAEEELRFEHRDLHWGNLLIEHSQSRTISMSLQGDVFDIPSGGIQVKIIDYTLSRLDKDGLTVFCDLSTDEELFLGEGDLQFEVYRSMRRENQNVWSLYKPHSNVLWLHYLCDKLLTEAKCMKKPSSAVQRRDLRRLQDFRREVRHYGSATEVLKRSRLFK